MFERLKVLYEQGRIDEQGLLNAVERGWITEAEFHMITGKIYKEVIGEPLDA